MSLPTGHWTKPSFKVPSNPSNHSMILYFSQNMCHGSSFLFWHLKLPCQWTMHAPGHQPLILYSWGRGTLSLCLHLAKMSVDVWWLAPRRAGNKVGGCKGLSHLSSLLCSYESGASTSLKFLGFWGKKKACWHCNVQHSEWPQDWE